MKKNEAIIKMV